MQDYDYEEQFTNVTISEDILSAMKSNLREYENFIEILEDATDDTFILKLVKELKEKLYEDI